ncbi:apoptosis facilitator Bcl-2-like protein 14 [Betta splendens]|uniref:Apoptosis facilitator Bcl-2-like protein 14 n=1 Tax=Betta splendens TaxID=158456 RepID=A0A6P7NBI5_BETSP|nr:apoptosis facilitator Bcl-2-like protein 14 [Betta splendens]XP_029016912.1 apoptosis facilitator Bcl-2-like protein 14 [Betta splendens]XP_029016913.1 apoptosis facilitator Bcl-2-like protein 14 [Betta splendens]
MANDREGSHDQNSNHSTSSTASDPEPTSDASDMEDTVEFRILMAYAQRRRPKPAAPTGPAAPGMTDSNGTAPTRTPEETKQKEPKKKKKSKKQWMRILKFFKCVRPQTEEKEPYQTPAMVPEEEKDEEDEQEDEWRDIKIDDNDEKDALAEVVARLTEIADEIPFTRPDIETDAEIDDVERAIGLILRETGDRVNEQELKKLKELFWDYSFFNNIIKGLLTRMGLKSPYPDSPGPHASPKTQMAVACEAISRLSALDTQPMNNLLGFGARYLHEQHASWAKELGGYEAAFEDDDEVQ